MNTVTRNDRRLATKMVLAAVAVGFAFSASVACADVNDEKRFSRQLAKHAVTEAAALEKLRPKAMCVCFGLNNHPGFILLDSNGLVGCAVPSFVGGDLANVIACDGDAWAPVVK